MLKQMIKAVLPGGVLKSLSGYKQMQQWKDRGYLEYAPQFVKEQVFLKYGVPKAPWVETGTFLGDTTEFLAQRFPTIYSIEPGKELFEQAQKRFAGRNVELFNDVSEAVFPKLLPELKGDLNFWLDGHYSAGLTFKGDSDCPVEDELKAIEANLGNFEKLAILIDDVRCFLPTSEEYEDYPSLDYLVDWARKHRFNWRIEQDIFVMRNFA